MDPYTTNLQFLTPDKGVSSTLAIILQYMHVSNQHIVHLQLCYMSNLDFKKGKGCFGISTLYLTISMETFIFPYLDIPYKVF